LSGNRPEPRQKLAQRPLSWRGRHEITPEREEAVRASLTVGNAIRKRARLVGTGNAIVARIAADMN